MVVDGGFVGQAFALHFYKKQRICKFLKSKNEIAYCILATTSLFTSIIHTAFTKSVFSARTASFRAPIPTFPTLPKRTPMLITTLENVKFSLKCLIFLFCYSSVLGSTPTIFIVETRSLPSFETSWHAGPRATSPRRPRTPNTQTRSQIAALQSKIANFYKIWFFIYLFVRAVASAWNRAVFFLHSYPASGRTRIPTGPNRCWKIVKCFKNPQRKYMNAFTVCGSGLIRSGVRDDRFLFGARDDIHRFFVGIRRDITFWNRMWTNAIFAGQRAFTAS